jgi:hypothetical protein
MTRGRLRRLAVMAVSALWVMAMGATATANAAVSAPSGEFPTGYFQVWSDSSPYNCWQEDGTSPGIYLGSCGSNHSDYWYIWQNAGNGYELANEHSGLCLTVESQSPLTINLSICSPYDLSQEWNSSTQSDPYGYIIENPYDFDCLWQSNNSVQLRETCDPTNVHDSWGLSG